MKKLLWLAFNEERKVALLSSELFDEALKDAIISIGAHLKRPYEQATAHRSPDYTEILWATSDSEDTIRHSEAIFSSYLRTHEKVHGRNPPPESLPLPQANFQAKLRDLKKKQYRSIIETALDRKGLYTYRENILRGFIAMKALEGRRRASRKHPRRP